MNILIAVQDSSILPLAERFLREHQWTAKTKALVLHVVDEQPYGYYADLDAQQHVIDGARKMIDSLVAELAKAEPTISFQWAVVKGDPKAEIVRYAEELPADLILIGSHGRGALGRFFMGSVSLAVHAAAPCSLLVLREPKDDLRRGTETKGAQAATATK